LNWLLLKNSLLVSALTTLWSVSLGLIAALWSKGLSPRWQRALLAVGILALALPPFLVTNCWLHFLGYTGVWRSWLPLNIFTLGGTVWILGLMLWPITFLMVWSAWQRLEPEEIESDMAVTGWSLVRGLLWPLGRTAIGQAALLTFVLALNNFAVPAILQVKVFPAEMWVRFTTSFDTLGALKLSWPLVAGPLLLLLWFSRREFPWPHSGTPVPPKLFRQQLGGGWFWLSGSCTLALCLLAAALPIAQLVSVKRTWTELPGALAAGQSAIWNSFMFAFAAATLVIGIALTAGALIECSSRWFQHARMTGTRKSKIVNRKLIRASSCQLLRALSMTGWVLWLSFLTPGVLLGISLIWLLNRPWTAFFYQSVWIVILAFVIRYLALGWFIVRRAVSTSDSNLVDAARMDGATALQTLRHAVWPQIAPQTATAWYVVFLLCLWDVETMILVWPPGAETLALRVFNLLHYGHNAQVNALCLTLLGLALTPLVLWGAWSAGKRAISLKFLWSLKLGVWSLLTLVASALAILPGCLPKSSSNEVPLSSKLFTSVRIIGSRGVGAGELNKPRSVAVDAQDNVYAVDMTGRVQKFSPDGKFILLWQMPQTDLGKPKGMCRDKEGNIIVVEPHYQRVNCFSPEGKLLTQWGQRGTNAGQFIMPRAVAVNSRGEIYVSEYGAVERVQRFAFDPLISTPLQRGAATASNGLNPEGLRGFRPAPETPKAFGIQGPVERPTTPLKQGVNDMKQAPRFLSSFGSPGTGPGEFNRPEGLCVDSQDRVYVADSCNHRIQIFSPEGEFLRAYGKPGTGLGELSYPYDIAVDSSGRQYVCEFGNSRIQVFDAHDQPIEIIGRPGTEPAQFGNPWSVALDSLGNLYVADSQNHRLQEFIRSPQSTVHGPQSTQPDQLLAISVGFRTMDSGLWTQDCGLWTTMK
jgi:ABC-type Fe3+ transport system permease subunit/DNA-binding beta-propeller fold protein YncE